MSATVSALRPTRVRLLAAVIVALASALALRSFFIHGAPAAAAGEQIVVTTEPPLGEIRPHGGPSAGLEPDKIIVEVRDSSGKPIPNVKIDVRLDTPGTNFLVSTDVPRIEGVTVINWSGVSPTGRQEFQYAFPIRGDYKLSVTASPAPGATGFSALTKETTLGVQEKGKSFAYLALFLAALFTFGLVSGIVLGRANAAARPR
ncbi:MAG TPA: hypothetical protein VFX49_21965 [Chloroflexota bacterium]|nr:hypothetical protein [Chloroflexota bacterium]